MNSEQETSKQDEFVEKIIYVFFVGLLGYFITNKLIGESMKIRSLQWDDSNINHIAEHSVNPEEVEDVCFGEHLVKKDGQSIYVLSGQTAYGRYINVVLQCKWEGVYRPATAFEMSSNYKNSYRSRLKKKAKIRK